MPPRMWPVNQPSLLIGYQFCSCPGRVWAITLFPRGFDQVIPQVLALFLL
jgi:hypothetical protein